MTSLVFVRHIWMQRTVAPGLGRDAQSCLLVQGQWRLRRSGCICWVCAPFPFPIHIPLPGSCFCFGATGLPLLITDQNGFLVSTGGLAGVVVLKQVAIYRREQDLHLCGGISGG